MTAARAILINGFTRLTLAGVKLGEMQIGNPLGVYAIPGADALRPEIEIAVEGWDDSALVDAVFDSPETGYVKHQGRFFYRNCNVANDMDWPEVIYRGRLPHARLRIRVETLDPLRIVAQATANYARESRSRLTRIPTLDETISNLALVAAIMRGYIPMHAAAVELGEKAARRSVLFMGLPNTGKTGTSAALCRQLGGRYLAEDIAFVRPDTRAVFGGPYTLDEQKAQDYAELRAAQFAGAPVSTLVMLRRSPGAATATPIARGSPALADFIVEMNRYEFEWNHDLILRHLLLGGAAQGWSSGAVLERYRNGMRLIAGGIDGVELRGEDPREWPALALACLAAP
jgi:hypothetical protein